MAKICKFSSSSIKSRNKVGMIIFIETSSAKGPVLLSFRTEIDLFSLTIYSVDALNVILNCTICFAMEYFKRIPYLPSEPVGFLCSNLIKNLGYSLLSAFWVKIVFIYPDSIKRIITYSLNVNLRIKRSSRTFATNGELT